MKAFDMRRSFLLVWAYSKISSSGEESLDDSFPKEESECSAPQMSRLSLMNHQLKIGLLVSLVLAVGFGLGIISTMLYMHKAWATFEIPASTRHLEPPKLVPECRS